MKEKERFANLHYFDDLIEVYDNESNSKRLMGISECFDLLNQQDARIRELEAALKKANINNYLTDYYLTNYYLFEKEKQQFKQEVNDWKQRFNSSDKQCKTLLQNLVTASELKNKKIKFKS